MWSHTFFICHCLVFLSVLPNMLFHSSIFSLVAFYFFLFIIIVLIFTSSYVISFFLHLPLHLFWYQHLLGLPLVAFHFLLSWLSPPLYHPLIFFLRDFTSSNRTLFSHLHSHFSDVVSFLPIPFLCYQFFFDFPLFSSLLSRSRIRFASSSVT